MRLAISTAMLLSSSLATAQMASEPIESSTASVLPLAVPDGHNLVIYREYAEPTAWSPTVKVDGVKIIAIPNKHYTSTRVEPGRHRVTLAWPILSSQHGGSMEIEVKDDGIVHYLEVVGVSRYDGFYITFGSGIGEARPEYAAKLISECCRYKAPK